VCLILFLFTEFNWYSWRSKSNIFWKLDCIKPQQQSNLQVIMFGADGFLFCLLLWKITFAQETLYLYVHKQAKATRCKFVKQTLQCTLLVPICTMTAKLCSCRTCFYRMIKIIPCTTVLQLNGGNFNLLLTHYHLAYVSQENNKLHLAKILKFII